MRIGIVVPHFFMNRDILPEVIFTPGELAINLAEGVKNLGAEVTLFSPGKVNTKVNNVSIDLSYFDKELSNRGYGYVELLKKHPLIFISLARQAQSELIAKAFEMANNDELDVIHIYTNEEDIALPFVKFCKKPVFFTHHDPFSFLIKYKHVFPKYKELNWISLSYAQRRDMPKDTNWVANIYHGIDSSSLKPSFSKSHDYVAYLGRIINPKGLHLAINAVKQYNQTHATQLKLKIAGKHYAGHNNDKYWEEAILPELKNESIEYIGMIKTPRQKQDFLGNAAALLVPSIFEEPFGLVMIESLACGTPIIGLDSGAIPEIISNKVGLIVAKSLKSIDGISELDEDRISTDLSLSIDQIREIDRRDCRQAFEDKFTLEQMSKQHFDLFKKYYMQLENN